MDALVLLIINVSVGAVAGIASAVKAYKEKKSQKKMKKRIEQLEKNEKEQRRVEQENEPIQTPSEKGYYKPENPVRFYAE